MKKFEGWGGLFASVALALALSGCALFEAAETPAQKVYAARVSYGAALKVALQYESLPRCGQPTSPAICSDAKAVDIIRQAQTAADTALNSAEATVLTPGFGDNVYTSAAISAVNAAAAFSEISNQFSDL